MGWSWGIGRRPPRVYSISGWQSDNRRHEIYSQSKGLRCILQLDSLAARCDAASLQMMHRMANENAPAHLQTLKPKMCREVHGASTRNANSKTLNQPKVRLVSTQNSFLPRTVSPWNKMPK